jgi:hypothetical protein
MQKVGFIGLGTMGMSMARGLGDQDLCVESSKLISVFGFNVRFAFYPVAAQLREANEYIIRPKSFFVPLLCVPKEGVPPRKGTPGFSLVR